MNLRMPPTEPWTIKRLLSWTTDYFRKSGSESPRLDAEVLLAHCCGCERIELYTAFDSLPADEVRKKFRGLVKRRGEGAPVAHLVGYREFYSLTFKVTPAVLIPRPETEFLVIAALDLSMDHQVPDRPPEIADIGTGSGAIAVTVAKHHTYCRITATDISREAIDVAAENADLHGVSERIEFVQCDLMDAVPADRQFDLVLSNPPYVADGDRESLARDVRDHEPPQALFAGPEGTDVIARLIPAAAERLLPGGWLAMEISPQIATAVSGMIDQSESFETPSFIKDLSGSVRVIKCRRLSQ